MLKAMKSFFSIYTKNFSILSLDLKLMPRQWIANCQFFLLGFPLCLLRSSKFIIPLITSELAIIFVALSSYIHNSSLISGSDFNDLSWYILLFLLEWEIILFSLEWIHFVHPMLMCGQLWQIWSICARSMAINLLMKWRPKIYRIFKTVLLIFEHLILHHLVICRSLSPLPISMDCFLSLILNHWIYKKLWISPWFVIYYIYNFKIYYFLGSISVIAKFLSIFVCHNFHLYHYPPSIVYKRLHRDLWLLVYQGLVRTVSEVTWPW